MSLDEKILSVRLYYNIVHWTKCDYKTIVIVKSTFNSLENNAPYLTLSSVSMLVLLPLFV